ncbi:unnamed protein product [Durusdinium trenchii]|uniref:F-box domain-containing protein n=1 Tax=Durusdinium trenchii TaxID=1381693 RepID=A0ABP0MLR4_9DINO
MTEPTPEPPVCCLFQDGSVWREILVVSQLAPKRYCCLNSDWVLSDLAGVSMLEALRSGAPCFFGSPYKPRFHDEEAQMGEAKCHWLRSSKPGLPLPNLHGDHPGKFHPHSMLKPGPAAGGGDEAMDPLPRGEGQGVLSEQMIQQLQKHLSRLKDLILDPHQFLLQALDTWEKLHLFLVPLMRGAQLTTPRKPQTLHNPLFPLNLQCEQDDDLEEASSERSEEEAEAGRERRLERQKAAKAQRTCRWRMLQGFQRAIECSWPILDPGTRKSLLSFAVDNLRDGLQQVVEEAMMERQDLEEVEELGMSSFLAGQLSQLQLGLATQRRWVGWSCDVPKMILNDFESQVGLSRRSKTHRYFGKIVCQTMQESGCPVMKPLLFESERLHLWTKAVTKMWKIWHRSWPWSPSPMSAVLPRAPVEDLGIWGQLPKAAQHVTLSFLLDWPTFNQLTATCSRLRTLCHEPPSWEGLQLKAQELDSHACGLLDDTGRQVLDREPHMNHWTVRFCRLGMALGHSERPILVCSGSAQFESLARHFSLDGVAWPMVFSQAQLSRFASTPGAQRTRKSMKFGDQPGPFDAQQEFLVTVPEIAEALSERRGLFAEVALSPRSYPGLGGTWYEVTSVEVLWSFRPEALLQAELLSLCFFQNWPCSSASAIQDARKLFLLGHGSKPSPAASLEAAAALLRGPAPPNQDAELGPGPPWVLGPSRRFAAQPPVAGVYLTAESEDPEEDEEDEEEEEEGCLSRAPGQLVVQAPYRLPDVSLDFTSGSQLTLAMVNVVHGRHALRCGLVVLQDRKVLGCCWCKGPPANRFSQTRGLGTRFYLEAASGSQLGFAAQKLSSGPCLEDLLNALQGAPYMRTKARNQ